MIGKAILWGVIGAVAGGWLGGIIAGASGLPPVSVWKEFKHPRHEEFAEPTRWSLLNAFTETAKKYSPARADQCYRSLTRLFGLDGKPAELWK